MGPQINSEGNEKFPVWNGDTLYFSSDYLPGMGGLDIFKTWRTIDGKWMSPLRLEYPINSGADDFNFTMDPKFVKKDSLLNRAVFSSNRNYKNGDDIYEFIKIQKAQPPIERKFKLKVFATFSYFKTLEYSANQKEETLDSIVINMDKQDGTIFTNNKSKISLQLSPGDSFEIQSGRRGYLNYRMNIVTPMISNLQQDSTINLEYKIKDDLTLIYLA